MHHASIIGGGEGGKEPIIKVHHLNFRKPILFTISAMLHISVLDYPVIRRFIIILDH